MAAGLSPEGGKTSSACAFYETHPSPSCRPGNSLVYLLFRPSFAPPEDRPAASLTESGFLGAATTAFGAVTARIVGGSPSTIHRQAVSLAERRGELDGRESNPLEAVSFLRVEHILTGGMCRGYETYPIFSQAFRCPSGWPRAYHAGPGFPRSNVEAVTHGRDSTVRLCNRPTWDGYALRLGVRYLPTRIHSSD